MAEEIIILGLGLKAFFIGLLALLFTAGSGMIFCFVLMPKLKEALLRYLGDALIANGIMSVVWASAIISVVKLSLEQLTLEYVSPVLNPIALVADSILGYVRWGAYLAGIIFIGFAIHHHANKINGGKSTLPKPNPPPKQDTDEEEEALGDLDQLS